MSSNVEVYLIDSSDDESDGTGSQCHPMETVPPVDPTRLEEASSWIDLLRQPQHPEISHEFALVVVERYLRRAADAAAAAAADAAAAAAAAAARAENAESEYEVDDDSDDDKSNKRGLTKEEIRRLPCCQYRPHKHGNQSKECLICLIKFKPRLLLRRLPCLHLFHRLCLDRWLSENHNCPHCRYSALPVDLDPEEICKLMSG